MYCNYIRIVSAIIQNLIMVANIHMSRKKIVIFGAGNVGGVTAFLCAIKELGDIVIIDTKDHQGLAIGKALDIAQSLSLFNADVSIRGSFDHSDIEGANICVVIAGFPRKPGTSRNDLYNANYQIIDSIASSIKTLAPNCIIVMVTNPLDAMTYAMIKLTDFKPARVIGMAGILDSIRFQSYLATQLNCSTKDIRALVLGSHGDDMVPVQNYSSVNGLPISHLLDNSLIEQLIEKTRNSGSEFVKLMGTSAYFAAASSVVSIIESILKDQKRIMPCSVLLNGEYGVSDTCIGVPVVLGKNGAEKILIVPLSNEELKQLQCGAESVKSITSSALNKDWVNY